MKIGIFGDSFGEPRKEVDNYRTTPSIAWPRLLRSKYRVRNYCESGSSFYFSYLQFRKHYKKLDKIIFLVTQPNRIYLPEHSRSEVSNPSDHHCSSAMLTDPNFFHKQGLDEYNKHFVNEIVPAVKSYYLHLQDDERDELFAKFMLRDILETRPDTLLVPCFNDRWCKTANTNITPLITITEKEEAFWGIDPYSGYLAKCTDLRQCHFSDANNKLFYNKIENWLSTGEFSWSLKEAQDPETDYSEYFTNEWKVE